MHDNRGQQGAVLVEFALVATFLCLGATGVGLTTAIGGAVAGLGTPVNPVAGPLVSSLDALVRSPILRSLAGADVAVVLDPVCLPTVLAR